VKINYCYFAFFSILLSLKINSKKNWGEYRSTVTRSHTLLFFDGGGGGRGDRWKVHNAAKLIDKNENTVQKKIDGQF
jgi:hypothetical protein